MIKICIKIIDGKSYIDKNFIEKFGIEQLPKYGYTIVEIDDVFYDCECEDFDGLFFNQQKYYERKSKELTMKYENMIVNEIRKKYSLNQELAILRQRDSKFYEYQEYFEYVEQCKSKAKQFFNLV